MAKNKFLITSKHDDWGGAIKKGEQFIVESNGTDRPSGLELLELLRKQGRKISSSSNTLVSQSWDIKKL